jgi:hypothetical protein
MLTKLLLANSITVFIVVINKVLTTISISMISWIGYDTHSELATKITNGVFIAQFLNTAILILLVNANLSDVSPFLGTFLDGKHNDYTSEWYQDIGHTLVQTMLINAFVPSISQFVNDSIAGLLRWKDRNYTSSTYTTSKEQVEAYVDLYAGPEYIVHLKYSSVFNVVYVTMFYGVGLPILFPIAVLTLFIFYCFERYHIAYTYRLPPSLDGKLTFNALNVLSYAPLLLLI